MKEKTLLSSLTEPLRIGPAAVAAGCTRAAYDQASQNSRGWGGVHRVPFTAEEL